MEKTIIKNLPYRPCVGAALFNAKGEVWVGKRILKVNDESRSIWQMPQGGIEAGEPPNVAVIRELEEETGVCDVEFIAETSEWLKYDLPKHLIGRAWNGMYQGQIQKWFALKYHGDDESFCLNKHENPEFCQWKWIALEELVEIAVYFKRDIYRAVVQQFSYIPKRLTNKKNYCLDSKN